MNAFVHAATSIVGRGSRRCRRRVGREETRVVTETLRKSRVCGFGHRRLTRALQLFANGNSFLL